MNPRLGHHLGIVTSNNSDAFAIGAQDVIQIWASYHGVEVSIHAEVDAFKPPPSKQILTPHLGKDQIVSTSPTN